jgi:hypothetical protein
LMIIPVDLLWSRLLESRQRQAGGFSFEDQRRRSATSRIKVFDTASGTTNKINDRRMLKNKQKDFKLQKATDCGTFCS